MEIQGKREVVEAAVTTSLTTVITELVTWGFAALKDRKPAEKDADGWVAIE